MLVSIDWSLCVGSGACVERAPDAFEIVEAVDSFTVRAILRGVATEDVLLEAAMACPTLAIQLLDPQGKNIYPA